MRLGTGLIFGLAVVFGSAAVAVSSIWLNGSRPLAAAVQDDVEVQDTIVVAAVPLRFGDRLTHENTREITWTAADLPPGAFQTRLRLLDADEGDRQVLTSIGTNEPILDWKITGPGQRATLSSVLEDGMTAMSIRVNDVLGVAGFVLPGDRVDVMLTRRISDEPVVDVLLQNLKVLAIDQSADDRREEATVVKTVTFEVSTLDAQKLTLASGVGTLSLSLKEAASSSIDTPRRVTLGDLERAGMPAAQAEPSAEIDAVPVDNSARMFTSVQVMRGVTVDTYNVPVRAGTN